MYLRFCQTSSTSLRSLSVILSLSWHRRKYSFCCQDLRNAIMASLRFPREIGLTRGIQKLMPCFDFRWSPLMFDIEYCRHSIIKSRPICIWKLWDFCMLHSFKVHVVATTDHCALISRYRISRSKLGRLFINNEFESSSSKLVFVNKKKTFSSTRFFGLVKTFKLV